MAGLAWSDFSDKVGHVYSVAAPGGPYPLTLVKAEPIGGSEREGGGFSLEFLGPVEPQLPQAAYAFSAEDPDLVIFIVPIARGESGVRYQAVFN